MNTIKLKRFKNYYSLIRNISKKNIFQKKLINKIISNQKISYFRSSEDILMRILKVAKSINKNTNIKKIADIYLWYTDLLKKEEIYFERNKKYRVTDYNKVFKNVYSKPDYMFKYAIGLGTSQLFWENHIKVFDFFLKNFVKKVKKNPQIAEIGMGHGLFTAEVFKKHKKSKSTMLDVSNMCLNFAERMSVVSGARKNSIKTINQDVQKKIPLNDNSLDGLLLGEVIEHLSKGKKVMKELSKKVKKDGICYFSTPANGPAEDHVLLFKNVKEIRKFIRDCSWKIIKDSPITLRNMSVKYAEENFKVINYCAILKKK